MLCATLHSKGAFGYMRPASGATSGPQGQIFVEICPVSNAMVDTMVNKHYGGGEHYGDVMVMVMGWYTTLW
eukprot:4622763-Pyramimonas_sp.AAC.3